MRPHEKFGTAVVVADGAAGERLRVDVASTRSESYEHPGALPKVEHAGIRSDLARRDFSINAMAVSLKPETFGDLLDYFGGLRPRGPTHRRAPQPELHRGPHPHPARPALRDPLRPAHGRSHLNLARACCAMDLVGDLSSARLRDELVSRSTRAKVDFALRRRGARRVAADPRAPAVDGDTRGLVGAGTSCAPRTPRGASAALASAPRLAAARPDPEEIRAWRAHARPRAGRRRAGARAGRGRRLADRVARGPSEADSTRRRAASRSRRWWRRWPRRLRQRRRASARSSTSRATCD